jgi:hypothetical protein
VRIASIDDMRWTDALKVGCAQALALFPGTSRSGATIIGGMLFGLSRVAATEFSFFLAIPTLLAATFYSLWKDASLIGSQSSPAFFVGFAAAFFSAFACVRWLIRYGRASTTSVPFACIGSPSASSCLLTAVRRTRDVGLDRAAMPGWIGPRVLVSGVLGFSFMAILIKLAYAWHPGRCR